MDRYRDRRSPNRPPYGRGPPPAGDSYVPRGSRPRSRSPPPFRRRSRSPLPRMNDRWTPRGRSPIGARFDPPPRDYYAPRDMRPRSPRRDYDGPSSDRYYPPARSPPHSVKRSREVSPVNGRPRSPMNKNRRMGSPPFRENFGRQRSPPGRRPYSPPPRDRGFRPHSRSPPFRREEREPYMGPNVWRRRSPSPRSSGHGSAPLSRRSSPLPQRPFDRRPPDNGNASFRSPRPRSPHYPERAPPRNNDEHFNPPARDYPPRDAAPNDDLRDRPPPSGPSNLSTPRHAPSSSAATPTSSAPPTGPSRGGGSFRGRGVHDHPRRGGYDFPRRGSHTWTAPPSGPGGRGRGAASHQHDTPSMPSRGPAHDAHESPHSQQGPPLGPSGFRGPGGSSSSKTYPLTRRFNVDAALASLPSLKAGGEPLPPLVDTAKAARLEDEAARLRKLIDEKRASGRRAMREWSALERQSAVAAERNAIVDEEVRGLVGESAGGAAF